MHISGLRKSRPDYSGALAPLGRIFDLSVSAFLTGTAFCVGRAITRRLSLEFANIAKEIPISVMAGTGILGLGKSKCITVVSKLHLPHIIF